MIFAWGTFCNCCRYVQLVPWNRVTLIITFQMSTYTLHVAASHQPGQSTCRRPLLSLTGSNGNPWDRNLQSSCWMLLRSKSYNPGPWRLVLSCWLAIGGCWRLACYDIIDNAWRCNLKHKESTCDQDHMLWLKTHLCDWSHTYETGDTLMRLESHIGDAICNWSHKYVTGDAICVWRRDCATAPVTSLLGDMLIRIAYIADHLDLISLSPLKYYSTFVQATKQPDT
jgi:hypothetical protein